MATAHRPLPADVDRAYTTDETRTVLQAALETFVDELAAGGVLKHRSLGTLAVIKKRGRQITSNLTGQPQRIDISEHWAVSFQAGKRLIQRININKSQRGITHP